MNENIGRLKKSRGLIVDGIVSIETKNALGKTTTTKPTSPYTSVSLNENGTIKKGSKGAAVTELQRLLTEKVYNTKGVDGVFGSNTDQAVRQFQKARGLAVDRDCW